MNYPLEYLTDSEFEDLVALICEKILGTATIVFSPGPDGGKDARFTGKANNYPSASNPWEGRIIIQAKHSQRVNASCSDSRFQTILKKEVIPAIDKFIKNDEIDYYLLFTNRKLSGVQDSNIESVYSHPVSIENRLIALENIQLWLKEYPHIAITLKLNNLLLPLNFDEEDLKNIIVEFSKLDMKSVTTNKDIKFINKKSKNKLNNLSKDYFNNVIKKNINYFGQIDKFLQDPINEGFQNMYQNTIDDLNEEILIHRNEYDKFDEIFNHLYKFILGRRPELHNNRKLIRLFLHYMYYNCDIGKKE